MLISAPVDPQPIDALLARIEAADGVPGLSEHKWLRRHDGTRARSVAGWIGDDVIGFATAVYHRRVEETDVGHWGIELAVDPGHRTADVFDGLIAAALGLVPSGASFVVWAWHDDVASGLERAGLHQLGALHRLERPLPLREAPRIAEEVAIKSFQVGQDESAWLEVNNAAFAGHPENGALTERDLTERYRLDWFNPSDIVMAWERGTLLGFCWTKHHPKRVGEIYIIGVDPAAQGRGLGRALILLGLDHLAGTGADTGMLYVDAANEAAMWLYSDLGFRAVWTNRRYGLPEA